MPISEEQKTNARKLSLVFCVVVTYNDKGEGEKKGSYGRY
jgi:hypothetical protein